MSVSHRGHSGDVETNIGSPLKPSYEGSPSPDFNFDSSSSTPAHRTLSICESRSPSPPTSFSSNFSNGVNSPVHSPLTSIVSSPVMINPSSLYSNAESPTSNSFMRSRSLSPNYSPSSPSTFSLPSNRSIHALSPNKAFSFVSPSSPLSPLKELPLRERCEAALLKARSLTNKHDQFHSNPSETFTDSDPFMPFVHSNTADQENLKPSSSILVVPQPSHSKNKNMSKNLSSDDNQLSLVADSYCSLNDTSISTSTLRERCGLLLKKSSRKIKSSNKFSNDFLFSCSSSSSKETLRQDKPKSIFNSNLTKPSRSLVKNSVTNPYSSSNQSLAEETSVFSIRAKTEPSSPLELAPISPPPYQHDFSQSESYSPPPYDLSPSQPFLKNQTALSPYHDYPSVSISCASTLYANSPDMMSVTVTTCSSTSNSGCRNNGVNLNIQPTKSSGQQMSLYNPPLNPQDYQTSPPIYKSSTSFPDQHTLDSLSGPLPSSSSSQSMMYSYVPFSSYLAAKVSTDSKISSKVNNSEIESTFSSGDSKLQQCLNSQQNSSSKIPYHAVLSQKHSQNTFQYSKIVSESFEKARLKKLLQEPDSLLQSNEISNSSQKKIKPSIASNKLIPSGSSNSVCEESKNVFEMDASHSSSHTVDPNLVIKADSPMAEVVDVEHQGPPSVVDLTCEDDDDVEIVSSDLPVVFLGSEPSLRRPSRRLRRAGAHSQSSSSSSEPIIVSDSPLDSVGDSPSNAINISDMPETTISSSEAVSSPSDGGHRTPQLFGDLFNQSVIPVDSDNESRIALSKNRRNLPSTSSQRTNYTSVAKNLLRKERNRDRSRSPLAGNEDSDLDPVEAPIPPDVLDDIASLYAESHTQHRLPVSLYKKNIFSTASDILHKAAYGLSNICMFTSHDRPVPPHFSQPSQPSTSSSDDSGGLSCPICFETFQDIKKAGRSLSSTVCGHIFCTNCLEAALKQTKLCPTCRKRLNKKQYHPLYI